MKLYQVIAQIVREGSDGWRSAVDVPTFYLRDDMIPDAIQAETVARGMILHMANDPTIKIVHISIAESREFDPTVIGA